MDDLQDDAVDEILQAAADAARRDARVNVFAQRPGVKATLQAYTDGVLRRLGDEGKLPEDLSYAAATAAALEVENDHLRGELAEKEAEAQRREAVADVLRGQVARRDEALQTERKQLWGEILFLRQHMASDYAPSAAVPPVASAPLERQMPTVAPAPRARGRRGIPSTPTAEDLEALEEDFQEERLGMVRKQKALQAEVLTMQSKVSTLLTDLMATKDKLQRAERRKASGEGAKKKQSGGSVNAAPACAGVSTAAAAAYTEKKPLPTPPQEDSAKPTTRAPRTRSPSTASGGARRASRRGSTRSKSRSLLNGERKRSGARRASKLPPHEEAPRPAADEAALPPSQRDAEAVAEEVAAPQGSAPHEIDVQEAVPGSTGQPGADDEPEQPPSAFGGSRRPSSAAGSRRESKDTTPSRRPSRSANARPRSHSSFSSRLSTASAAPSAASSKKPPTPAAVRPPDAAEEPPLPSDGDALREWDVVSDPASAGTASPLSPETAAAAPHHADLNKTKTKNRFASSVGMIKAASKMKMKGARSALGKGPAPRGKRSPLQKGHTLASVSTSVMRAVQIKKPSAAHSRNEERPLPWDGASDAAASTMTVRSRARSRVSTTRTRRPSDGSDSDFTEDSFGFDVDIGLRAPKKKHQRVQKRSLRSKSRGTVGSASPAMSPAASICSDGSNNDMVRTPSALRPKHGIKPPDAAEPGEAHQAAADRVWARCCAGHEEVGAQDGAFVADADHPAYPLYHALLEAVLTSVCGAAAPALGRRRSSVMRQGQAAPHAEPCLPASVASAMGAVVLRAREEVWGLKDRVAAALGAGAAPLPDEAFASLAQIACEAHVKGVGDDDLGAMLEIATWGRSWWRQVEGEWAAGRRADAPDAPAASFLAATHPHHGLYTAALAQAVRTRTADAAAQLAEVAALVQLPPAEGTPGSSQRLSSLLGGELADALAFRDLAANIGCAHAMASAWPAVPGDFHRVFTAACRGVRARGGALPTAAERGEMFACVEAVAKRWARVEEGVAARQAAFAIPGHQHHGLHRVLLARALGNDPFMSFAPAVVHDCAGALVRAIRQVESAFLQEAPCPYLHPHDPQHALYSLALRAAVGGRADVKLLVSSLLLVASYADAAAGAEDVLQDSVRPLTYSPSVRFAPNVLQREREKEGQAKEDPCAPGPRCASVRQAVAAAVRDCLRSKIVVDLARAAAARTTEPTAADLTAAPAPAPVMIAEDETETDKSGMSASHLTEDLVLPPAAGTPMEGEMPAAEVFEAVAPASPSANTADAALISAGRATPEAAPVPEEGVEAALPQPAAAEETPPAEAASPDGDQRAAAADVCVVVPQEACPVPLVRPQDVDMDMDMEEDRSRAHDASAGSRGAGGAAEGEGASVVYADERVVDTAIMGGCSSSAGGAASLTEAAADAGAARELFVAGPSSTRGTALTEAASEGATCVSPSAPSVQDFAASTPVKPGSLNEYERIASASSFGTDSKDGVLSEDVVSWGAPTPTKHAQPRRPPSMYAGLDLGAMCQGFQDQYERLLQQIAAKEAAAAAREVQWGACKERLDAAAAERRRRVEARRVREDPSALQDLHAGSGTLRRVKEYFVHTLGVACPPSGARTCLSKADEEHSRDGWVDLVSTCGGFAPAPAPQPARPPRRPTRPRPPQRAESPTAALPSRGSTPTPALSSREVRGGGWAPPGVPAFDHAQPLAPTPPPHSRRGSGAREYVSFAAPLGLSGR
eukprot:TRINITY_DN1443_c0_g1_i1.p1 TRINITY_DN1443_c0_g1~~TRINITY_DN1443_c0_g1_i1.p1  ORF type:complete len:1731 (+),score=435.83 TRINITY_DN1443_c0_g1_i1:144-5336(+)